MNTLRCMERFFCKTEYIEDTSLFPMVNDDDFTYMEIEAMHESDKVTCFVFYRKDKGETYIEIYMWDVMLPCAYRRFVIKEGYTLKPEEEDVLLEYLYQDIQIDEGLLVCAIKRIAADYPQIHLVKYGDLRHSLLHIYFTLHMAGPMEILYKVNLDYLAAGLNDMECYNIIGSSPQNIFGVQLGMLRALNSKFGCSILSSEKNRELASAIFGEFHNFITGHILNECQWKYLVNQYESRDSVDKRTLEYFGELEDISQYYTFCRYVEYKKLLVDDYYSILPKYPDVDELDDNAKVCDMIEHYIEHERALDYNLNKKMKRIKEQYIYDTEEYFVMIPDTLKELLKEAESQHNCLYKYVLSAAFDREEAIVFVRSKKAPNKSLITMEIEGGRIEQALCAFNRVPNAQQQEFIEAFAKEKGLTMSADFDDDWWDDDDEEESD